MPQLDKYTFFNQFLWLIIIFLLIYYVFCIYILPKIKQIFISRFFKILYLKLIFLKKKKVYNKFIKFTFNYLRVITKYFKNFRLSRKIYKKKRLLRLRIGYF